MLSKQCLTAALQQSNLDIAKTTLSESHGVEVGIWPVVANVMPNLEEGGRALH